MIARHLFACTVLMLCVLALCLAALVAEDYNPFLYFRF